MENVASNSAVAETEALVPAGAAGALAVQSLEELMELTAGVGGGDAKASDMAIPFIAVLQKNSPQIDDTNGKFIAGSKQGMLFNTVTNVTYDARNEPIRFVEVATRKMFVEWVPRDSGGGFVGQHSPESEIVAKSFVDEKGKRFVSRGGNSLIETAYHFVLVLNAEGGYEPAVLGLSSTQLKFSRRLNYVIQTKTVKNGKGDVLPAARFAYIYAAKTKSEQNEKGSWFAWDLVGQGEKVTDVGLFQAAMALRKQIDSGAIQTAAPPQDEGGAGDHGAPSKPAGGTGGSDDVPF